MIVLFAILATALADVHQMQLTQIGNYDSGQYVADVSIGTPEQDFKWPADAEGVVGKDTVRLGANGPKKFVIPGTVFGQAAKFRSTFSDNDVDGVLGLGFPTNAAGGITPPVNRAIDLHLLDEPVFTVYMKAANGKEGGDGGLVTYGAVDTTHCGQILAYEPLTSKTHWQFAITSVTSGKYHSTAKWSARSDTTNSFIEMPAPEAAAIADAHGAKWDNDLGHYVIDCKAKASMELTIGQRKYTIEAKNFVLSAPDGRCVLALKPLATMTFGYVMSLGVPFHRQFCTYPPLDAEGLLGNDTVRLGAPGSKQLIVPGTVFGRATKFSAPFIDNEIDGVLGLAFPVIAPSRITPPMSRAVQLNLVDDPLFTVYLKSSNDKTDTNGGVITYGAIDTEHCGPVTAYEPLTTPTHWQFKLVAVTSGNFHMNVNCRARSDTSSSFIGAPAAEADAIVREHKATWNEDLQHYVIDCDAKPTMMLKIGKQNYTIHSENLVLQLPDGGCALALKALSGQKFSPIWTLGIPFHRQYCTVHDFAQERIGFAKPKN
ncbi:unnamed protein product [Haemonchus placei]|uniref:Peptidase A1 domain-containing protein n=1 Tax=Haemonchus placei TaxID=6290 RepID=A0A0N4WRT0_HAEPC|nr:unnamed protein product [Haemonchus placei]